MIVRLSDAQIFAFELWQVKVSLEIHTLFYSQKNISTHTTKKTLLEREYGGGSMFEFRAKMTVVKETANKRLVLL